MKRCKYCGKYYPESEFGVALTTEKKVYHRHKCKNCYRATKKRLQERYKKWLADYKKKQKCSRCGFKDYRALEFHHLEDKKFSIAERAYYHYGIKRLEKELKKCIVLCANCHRILHDEERNNNCANHKAN